jgi:hypothetical protein
MEELVHYDPHLVVGILGGAAGTTYDAFKLLSEAKKYGARAALFGRKINNAENQLAFVRFLRLIADGEVTAEEAVRAYHGVLQRLGIQPHRSLEEDMKLQSNVMSYGGNGVVVSVPPGEGRAARGEGQGRKNEERGTRKEERGPTATRSSAGPASASCGCNGKKGSAAACACKQAEDGAAKTESNGEPDFSQMTAAQKVAYHRARWDRILG